MTHTILALDCSSTTMGWVIWNGSTAVHTHTIVLKGDLAKRLILAELAVSDLIRQFAPDAVAIEGATVPKRFPGHVIAQQRVCGVVLWAIERAGLLSLEISPATAKKVLSGTGRADKAQMIKHAEWHLGPCDEHQADALGVAMAAWPMVKVEQVAA